MAQRISRAKQTITGSRVRLQPARRGGADRAAARRAARALPGLQRGLHGQRRRRADRARAVAGGHPADPLAAPAAAGRRRGGRPAGADAADRRAAARPHAAGRVAGAAGRPGPGQVGPGADRRGNRADQRGAAARRGRALPAAGGHRRRPRRGHDHGRHRLAADPGALRPAGTRSRRTRSPRSTARWRWPWCTGRRPGCEVLAALAADKRMARHHRLLATRAHLRELAGDDRRGGRRLPARRRAARPACPNAATWPSRPRG